ncbi:NAD(P)-dependent alcohol dehydrogenase [Streptomyces sp. NPDC002889]|uniref:NAD(P)-dependent alcohol dehydrogenase n=1 Tax=Streptomyces sp. NPDC002889 TaxID=3364669 RepID=UPI0036964412
MKAIVQDVYGPPAVLRLEEIGQPVPGSGEVLVRVHAAAVDQGVWHLMTGRPYLLRAMGFGLRAPKVRVRGMDVAGRVEAVGPDVTRFRPGDEVYGTCDGSFAEYACAAQDRLAHKPERLGFEQAAAVPASACTALQALRDAGGLQAGQTVLVIGAAGGVGTFAVQLAKAFGAHVTGVCSTDGADLVRSIGADEVIDYTREDPTDGTRRYDLVIDTAGNRSLSRLRRALTPRGTLVIVGGEGGGKWLGGTDRQLRALLLSPFVGHRLRGLASRQPHSDLRLLAELIEAGSVTPVIERTYPLADVPAAVHYLAEGHARGKTVIRV